MAAIERCAGYRIYNLGNSRPVSLTELVAAIEEAMVKNAVIELQPLQAGDVERTFADVTLAKAELGYRPTTDLATGLKHFVAWFRATNR